MFLISYTEIVLREELLRGSEAEGKINDQNSSIACTAETEADIWKEMVGF